MAQRPSHVQAPEYLTKSPPVPVPDPLVVPAADATDATDGATPDAPEYGGREGPEPTRYGDWEHKGIAWDF